MKVHLPPHKLDPFTDGDEVARLINYLIGEAERQIRGIEKGPQRLEAVTEAVMDSVVLPMLIPKKVARHMVQVLYHHIAKNVPDHLRLSKTSDPAPDRE